MLMTGVPATMDSSENHRVAANTIFGHGAMPVLWAGLRQPGRLKCETAMAPVRAAPAQRDRQHAFRHRIHRVRQVNSPALVHDAETRPARMEPIREIQVLVEVIAFSVVPAGFVIQLFSDRKVPTP